MDIQHVLCPVDFSDFSRRALDYAIAVARWYSARVTVLYVHPVTMQAVAELTGVAGGPQDGLVLSSADRERLRGQLQTLTRPEAIEGVPVTFSVAEGDVAGEIVAEGQSADLLVMGTHGRAGFEHLVLGSVTEKVMRKATCPLLTIPRSSPDRAAAVPTLFHRILAGVDFSDASMQALDYAVSLAEEADAHLTVLHVTHIPRELARWAEQDQEGQRHVEQWKAYAQTRLRPLVSEAARVYCHVDERVETGEPYREILRVATEQQSGLIVIGAHGVGVLERVFVGSTAQHIVRQAVCPVLTVRASSARRA